MVEVGVIGSKRLEYLDLANKAYSSRDYQSASAFLESFMTTVRDDSGMSKDIKTEFDRIEKKRVETWEKAITETESMDTWTQSEVRSESRIALSLEVLHDKIDSCWKIAIGSGGFYD